MVTTHQLWLLPVLFLIGPSLSTTPSIQRLNRIAADSVENSKPAPCSHHLEKLRLEAERHVAALNAITDDAARKSRPLLSTAQPAPRIKPLSNALLTRTDSRARLPVRTGKRSDNYLVKYLSSIDHTGWVSKCLEGGKCIGNGEDGKRINTGEESGLKTIPLEKDVENNNLNETASNPIIDLLPPYYNEGDKQQPVKQDKAIINETHYTSSINPAVIDSSSKMLYKPKLGGRYSNSSTNDNQNKPLDDIRNVDVPQTNYNNLDSTSFIAHREFNSVDNYFPAEINPQFVPINMLRTSTKLVHYNNVLPLTVQFTPMYYQRYPRSGSFDKEPIGAIERTFAPNQDRAFPVPDEGVSSGVETLDSLASSYGNDLVKRDSTGKRESEFSYRNEAVSTNYPEESSSSPPESSGLTTSDGRHSNVYLFLGGNWVANFEEKPQLFYIQPRYSSTDQNSAIITSDVPHHHLSPANPIFPPGFDQPPSYQRAPKSPSITVNDFENKVSSFPTVVAARNGYSWYHVNYNDPVVNTKPAKDPLNTGPAHFPDTPCNNPNENRRGLLRSNEYDGDYEDTLINFPQKTYEPDTGENKSVKPEETKAHDIDLPDLITVGTQMLSTSSFVAPSEMAADSDDAAYGQLVADVSSRSYPYSTNKYSTPTAAYQHQVIPQRTSLDRSNFPAPYFVLASPNEYEFVSGQWVRRKPITDITERGFIYDPNGRRRIRNIEVGQPGITLNDIQPPTRPFKSECFTRAKTLNNNPSPQLSIILPQQEQLQYFANNVQHTYA